MSLSESASRKYAWEAHFQDAERTHEKRNVQRRHMRLYKSDMLESESKACLAMCPPVGSGDQSLRESWINAMAHAHEPESSDVEWMSDEVTATETSDEGKEEEQAEYELKVYNGTLNHLRCNDECRESHWRLLCRIESKRNPHSWRQDRRLTSRWQDFRGFEPISADCDSPESNDDVYYVSARAPVVPVVPVDSESSIASDVDSHDSFPDIEDTDSDTPLTYYRSTSPEIPKKKAREDCRRTGGGYYPYPRRVYVHSYRRNLIRPCSSTSESSSDESVKQVKDAGDGFSVVTVGKLTKDLPLVFHDCLTEDDSSQGSTVPYSNTRDIIQECTGMTDEQFDAIAALETSSESSVVDVSEKSDQNSEVDLDMTCQSDKESTDECDVSADQ